LSERLERPTRAPEPANKKRAPEDAPYLVLV